MIDRKQWRYKMQGQFVVGRQLDDGTLDIYRGARTLEGARRARREVSHWPNVRIYDQSTGEFV